MASLYICLGGLRVFDPDLQLLSMHGVEKMLECKRFACNACIGIFLISIMHACSLFYVLLCKYGGLMEPPKKGWIYIYIERSSCMHGTCSTHACIIDSYLHSFMHMEFAGENAGEKRKRKSKSRRRRRKRTTVPSRSNDREEESEHRFLIIYLIICIAAGATSLWLKV